MELPGGSGDSMAASASVVLGIDGDTSKTVCVALDLATRAVIGRGTAGSTNWYVWTYAGRGRASSLTSMPSCRTERQQDKNDLVQAIKMCLEGCGKAHADVASVCIGTAGVDSPEDVNFLTNSVKMDFPPHVDVVVYSDSVTALASGTGGVLHGCVLIAGACVSL